MPQIVKTLSDGTPQVSGRLGDIARMNQLPANMSIERREDGSVWLIEKVESFVVLKGDQKATRFEDSHEMRVDSAKDRDFVLKGGTLWYTKYLKSPKAPKKDAE